MLTITWTKMIFISWMIVLFSSDVPSKLEGNFFPVTSELHLTVLTEFPFMTAQGSVKKLRSCNFEELKWYIVYPGTKMRIDKSISVDYAHYEDKFERYGPVELLLPYDFVMSHSEIYVIHDCHPFWYTSTRIFGE